MATVLESPSAIDRGKKFVLNVFWNWMGVGAGLISGLLLSPYMIRKLGPEGYGVYALSFLLVEYYWFLDLGFRSATVKYVAHYWATREFNKVSEVVNTAVTYASLAAGVVFCLVVFGARYLDRFFRIPATYRKSFLILVLLVSASWCFNIVFSLFGACLEAIQRFDYYNRVLVTVTTIRSVGTLVLLYLGYGLVEIGALVVCSQIFGYFFHFYLFRRVYPEYRLSVRGATLPMLRQMGSYGIHNFLGNISTQVINQGPPVLVAHFMEAQFVGFFQIPVRLLQYTSEAVGRIGVITNSSAAELVARGELKPLSQLAVFTNRYCVTLFMPLAIVLATHGTRFFELWVPKAAAASAPLLLPILIGYMIAFVGQFSSSMLLMGLARYQWYARGLLAEAFLGLAAMIYVIPRHGILGAAWITAIAMILNRGLFLPWLVSRVMHFRFVWFMSAIYGKPFAAAVPVFALAVWLGATVLPGRNWLQFFLVAAVVAVAYYAIAFRACLPGDHRTLVRRWVVNRLTFAVPTI